MNLASIGERTEMKVMNSLHIERIIIDIIIRSARNGQRSLRNRGHKMQIVLKVLSDIRWRKLSAKAVWPT
jgi:hypothetical protein